MRLEKIKEECKLAEKRGTQVTLDARDVLSFVMCVERLEEHTNFAPVSRELSRLHILLTGPEG